MKELILVVVGIVVNLLCALADGVRDHGWPCHRGRKKQRRKKD